MMCHRVLERQLKKLGLDGGVSPTTPSLWNELLTRISQTYDDADGSRHFLEHAWRVTSEEMEELYENQRKLTEAQAANERHRLQAVIGETEEELRRAHQRLTSHVENSPLAVIEWDKDRQVRYWSPQAERIFGWKADEIVNRSLREIRWIYQDDAKAARRVLQRLLHGRSPHSVSQNRNYRKDGTVVYCEWYNSALIDEAGTLVSILSLVQDITERKKVEEDYKRLFEDSHDAVFISTVEGKILRANQAMLELYGYDDDEMTTIHAVQLYKNKKDRKRLQVEMEKHGAVKNFPIRMKKKDGAEMDILITATALRDDRDRVVAYQGILHDVTERNRQDAEIRSLNLQLGKRVEERTRQLKAANEDLKAFSYSVSHDLKAPLRAIDGFAKILVEKHYDRMDAESKDALDEICLNVSNMRELIDDVLVFFQFGEKPMRLRALDMESLVQNVMAELKKGINQTQPGRRIRFVINSPIPPAHGDKAMIRQVWFNIISNSIKFSRPKEEARIEIGCQNEIDHCCYYVKDNGVGFDMNFVDKVFAVFERLHRFDEFEGTGVGLALVQRIIHRHGGSVRAEGSPNRGATIYFTLKKGNRKNG